jgi:hypothetical protein
LHDERRSAFFVVGEERHRRAPKHFYPYRTVSDFLWLDEEF